MQSQALKVSLCQSCIHAPDCFHYQKSLSAGRPVFFCEYFDDAPPVAPAEKKNPGPEKPGRDWSKLHHFKDIPGRMQGLCLNCAKRETCTFPVLEGGVWFCEEYN